MPIIYWYCAAFVKQKLKCNCLGYFDLPFRKSYFLL